MAEQLETVVLESLDKEDPNIVRAACMLAGLLGLAPAERGLLKALGHQAWQVQAAAAEALGKIGSQGAVPFLRRLLKASEADLRQKVLAAAALTKSAPPASDGETHPEVKRAAAVALNRIQPQVAEDALLGALASGQASLMEAAMAGLGNLESTGGRDEMLALLEHQEPAVRAAAAACLGRLREERAVDGLIKLLSDPEASVRREAVIALNHLKAKRAVEALTGLMDDQDDAVRRVAAIALGNTRHKDAAVVGSLRKGLGDRDAAVREACLKALANVRATEALEAAAALLADTHEPVQKAAAATVVVLSQMRQRPDYDFS